MSEETQEEVATDVGQIEELLPMAPISIARLAESVGAEPTSKIFRRGIWQAIEAYRARTGIHLVQRDGMIEAVTPEEQLREARRRFETARVRMRRGAEIASGSATRDPSMVARAERLLDREATREPTLANEARELRAANLRKLLLGNT